MWSLRLLVCLLGMACALGLRAGERPGLDWGDPLWKQHAIAGEYSLQLTAFPDPSPENLFQGAPWYRQGDISILQEIRRLFGENPGISPPHLGRLATKVLLSRPLWRHGNYLQLLTRSQEDVDRGLYLRITLTHMRKLEPIKAPPGWFAVDLHIHTCYSHDSFLDLRQVCKTAVAHGLAGIAVTDHDEIAGALAAQHTVEILQRAGQVPLSFFVIAGEEISSRDGHIVGLFLERRIPADLPAGDTIDAIHQQGGLAIAAHPWSDDGVGTRLADLPFDGVETENANERLDVALRKEPVRKAREAYYADLQPAAFGASDAHDPNAVGLCYTLLEGDPSPATVRAAIMAGRTRAAVRLTDARERALARRMVVGAPIAIITRVDKVSLEMDKWLTSVTHADRAALTLWPNFGIYLEKRF